MRLADHELKTRQILTKARVDNPGLCARLLTAHAAGLDQVGYILAWDQELPGEKEMFLARMVSRRAKGEPLAYILGSKEFYGLDFFVSPATLTPRPETELLVDLAFERVAAERRVTFADLGCGSGCIGLTLLRNRPAWQGILLDNSLPALRIAVKNSHAHALRPIILQGDIFQLPLASSSLDLLISNPPYIGLDDANSVMWETLEYEPHGALFSGNAGLGHLEAITGQAKKCLKNGGIILLEHGFQQGGDVALFLEAQGFVEIETHADLAGLPRCASARKP